MTWAPFPAPNAPISFESTSQCQSYPLFGAFYLLFEKSITVSNLRWAKMFSCCVQVGRAKPVWYFWSLSKLDKGISSGYHESSCNAYNQRNDSTILKKYVWRLAEMRE